MEKRELFTFTSSAGENAKAERKVCEIYEKGLYENHIYVYVYICTLVYIVYLHIAENYAQ